VPEDAIKVNEIWLCFSRDLLMKSSIIEDLCRQPVSSTVLLYYLDAWQASPFLEPLRHELP
jgi:hypothetical protein